ncbi:hypothetical protein BJX61DRAFT_494158 [Aspergillus egyptiacus]|nr:hypothetical protein BJX61DRAFT_494158 [Aspergillus egyptiacus]
MDTWHRNARLLHQIDEFLDVDSAHPHFVADFIALIDAVREGLNQIDDELRIHDSQINIHFLAKLKPRPEWRDWAMMMLQDSRINSGLTDCLSFRELADLALKQERTILRERQIRRESGSGGDGYVSELEESATPRALTQDDVNAFVVGQMSNQRVSRHFNQTCNRNHNGHVKRPSQEEINDYVIRQMRRDQEKARARSYSQPERRGQDQPHQEPVKIRCTFCGDTYHQSTKCWRRWRVAAEALQGNAAPKFVETRYGVSVHPRIYVSGFTPF